ncbi:hypothetical protein CAOG_01778 [Capsaspora owczarzaki ATCC 30864]|uniref:dihydroneopterin aldolase n=1 Tax=Capsaspora owczarzaki (strain ATCC 30864) TaxID=595528 RepID=A0A0D2WL23_CAPO3|nr:hypothetical protein CAOG_01778 [Capsaspora owczarzaki ATCC 30864]KJE90468.1 hypothetical protein CAOG_001778 [Capsaspora owczarzaki ATCC 30864]|eukprot:XP_004364646.1 hypothetical protein CAOG_01778 [Capsaspora owczarzaki ATCC 30864]
MSASSRQLPPRPRDTVVIRNLAVRTLIGTERWDRAKEQPMIVTLSMQLGAALSGADDLAGSYHYGLISKAVAEYAEKTVGLRTVEALACGIAQLCIVDWNVDVVTVRVERPTALLVAKAAGVEITRSRADHPTDSSSGEVRLVKRDMTTVAQVATLYQPGDRILISGMSVRAIIGVNPWEREQVQDIILNLTIYPALDRAGGAAAAAAIAATADPYVASCNFRYISKAVVQFVEASQFKTVEALVVSVARLVVVECLGVARATVRVEKPSALIFAESAGVEVTRDASDFTS